MSKQIFNTQIFAMCFKNPHLDNYSPGAYISDCNGLTKLVTWKNDATSENDFDYSQESIKLDLHGVRKICLTSDDAHLLIGSNQMLTVLNTKTNEVTEKFELLHWVRDLS